MRSLTATTGPPYTRRLSPDEYRRLLTLLFTHRPDDPAAPNSRRVRVVSPRRAATPEVEGSCLPGTSTSGARPDGGSRG